MVFIILGLVVVAIITMLVPSKFISTSDKQNADSAATEQAKNDVSNYINSSRRSNSNLDTDPHLF